MNHRFIHPTAIIEDNVELGNNVEIGPYAIIKSGVSLKDNVIIKSHAIISGSTTIGENSVVWPFATIGSQPQDLKYKGEKSTLICGSNNIFREYCNISGGTNHGGGITKIGSHNLFMINTHVAHDCIIGNHCILVNGVSLAGHIEVDDYAILGGHSACHQFIKVGTFAMLAGGSMVSQDVLPYSVVHGNHAKPIGVNLIGLNRHSFSPDNIANIKKMYKLIYRSQFSIAKAKEEIAINIKESKEKTTILNFLERSNRGLCR